MAKTRRKSTQITFESVPQYVCWPCLRMHACREELAAAFNPKTKLLLLNTPHNPSGKVRARGPRSSGCALTHASWGGELYICRHVAMCLASCCCSTRLTTQAGG